MRFIFKKYSICGWLLLLFFAQHLSAQETLTGLQFNPKIEQHIRQQNVDIKGVTTNNAALTLPFFDDFKYDGPYPDAAKWSDREVFVNDGYQKIPANRGVATFDALDEWGRIYEHATFTPFEADHLTSRKIRLDSLFGAEERPILISDSLYLSFYFQPQGVGNKPEPKDILELQFFENDADTSFIIIEAFWEVDTLWLTDSTWSKIDSIYHEADTTISVIPEQWKTIWSSEGMVGEGMSIDTFYAYHGTWMKHVMIPIIDTADLRPDFRFRFRNYASIGNSILPDWQSNMDQWNIDYVYLNYNRYWFDTTYRDISFVEPAVSLLKNYTAMPYSQFKNDAFNCMRQNFEFVYSNLDKNVQNVDYRYRIFNSNGSIVNADYSKVEWTDYVMPFIYQGVETKTSEVVTIYPIAPLADSNLFIVKQWLIGDDDQLSDSITYTQIFANYYAYDDGTPEAGYGLTPAESKMAVHFTLNHKDTLRAVDIFFNNTKERNNGAYSEYFQIAVWNDNHGKPDQLLYTQRFNLEYEHIGHFARFYFNEPIPVAAGGVFIGIVQETDANLNIGFDYSNNQQSQLFYKTPAENWKNSAFMGSLLFRPIFGKPIHDYPEPETERYPSLTVSPNPCTSNAPTITVRLPYSFRPNEHRLFTEVYNMLGQRIYANTYSAEIQLHNVTTGVYIIRVSNYTTGSVESTPFIIQ